MRKLILPFLFFVNICLFSQEAAFMDKLIFKEKATFGDLVTLFSYLSGEGSTEDFDSNLRDMKMKFKFFPKDVSETRKITVGDFSLFAIQYLKIESGLFYLATRSERYASRELIDRKIVPFNTSEYNNISGLELISYLQKVVGYEESVKN